MVARNLFFFFSCFSSLISFVLVCLIWVTYDIIDMIMSYHLTDLADCILDSIGLHALLSIDGCFVGFLISFSFLTTQKRIRKYNNNHGWIPWQLYTGASTWFYVDIVAKLHIIRLMLFSCEFPLVSLTDVCGQCCWCHAICFNSALFIFMTITCPLVSPFDDDHHRVMFLIYVLSF